MRSIQWITRWDWVEKRVPMAWHARRQCATDRIRRWVPFRPILLHLTLHCCSFWNSGRIVSTPIPNRWASLALLRCLSLRHPKFNWYQQFNKSSSLIYEKNVSMQSSFKQKKCESPCWQICKCPNLRLSYRKYPLSSCQIRCFRSWPANSECASAPEQPPISASIIRSAAGVVLSGWKAAPSCTQSNTTSLSIDSHCIVIRDFEYLCFRMPSSHSWNSAVSLGFFGWLSYKTFQSQVICSITSFESKTASQTSHQSSR